MTMTKRLSFKKYLIASALSLGAAGSLTMALIVPTTPAQAIIVFDPSNYSQNILTAARTLQQINNQIRMLQNQATSLINQAKNLTTNSFPELQALKQTISQLDQLIGKAQGLQFRYSKPAQPFRTM